MLAHYGKAIFYIFGLWLLMPLDWNGNRSLYSLQTVTQDKEIHTNYPCLANYVKQRFHTFKSI